MLDTLENVLEIQGLSKKYVGFGLLDVSLSLPSGTILGLVGENGAGKTTLIKLIMNTVGRDSGTVRVLGMDNQAAEFVQLKNKIGVVLDEAYFPEIMTPKQVNAIMKRTYEEWSDEQFFAYMERFDLPIDKRFKAFSRGMKMKLAIAVALAHSPSLLLLDEPTGGLDPMVREEILDILNEFTRSEEHSILIASHIVSDLEKICDYIAFMHKGQLLFCEEKDRLLEEYALVKLSRENFADVPMEAVLGMREGAFGVEALVRRSLVNSAIVSERTTLEEIILYMAKGADE
jgi:ABC-2 type transport system ATP-binding protein